MVLLVHCIFDIVIYIYIDIDIDINIDMLFDIDILINLFVNLRPCNLLLFVY